MRKIVPFAVLLLLAPTLLWAQEATIPIPSGINWLQLAAMLINTLGVTLLIQLAKKYMPNLSRTWKQVLTAVAGPALLFAANALSNLLGFPIDFTSLIEVIGVGLMSSAAATIPFKIGKTEGRQT